MQYGSQTGSSPVDYDRATIADTTIDVNSSGRPWTFQYCTEFGWYQTMSEEHPMRSPVIDQDYFAQYCSDAFEGKITKDKFPKAE